MKKITFDAILEKAVTNYTYQLAKANDMPKAHRHTRRTIEVSMLAVLWLWASVDEPLTFTTVKEVVETVYSMNLMEQAKLKKRL